MYVYISGAYKVFLDPGPPSTLKKIALCRGVQRESGTFTQSGTGQKGKTRRNAAKAASYSLSSKAESDDKESEAKKDYKTFMSTF